MDDFWISKKLFSYRTQILLGHKCFQIFGLCNGQSEFQTGFSKFNEPCTSLNVVWQELYLFRSSSLSNAIETRTRHRKVFILFYFKINRYYLEVLWRIWYLLSCSYQWTDRTQKKWNERAGRINKVMLSSSLFVSCLGFVSRCDVCGWFVVNLYVIFIQAEAVVRAGGTVSYMKLCVECLFNVSMVTLITNKENFEVTTQNII